MGLVEEVVRIFRSFAEADAAGAHSRRSMTPEERVEIFIAIQQRVLLMPLSQDLRQFVECLNSNKVEFLVVRALAVSWHRFPRSSADIDFFICRSSENAERVLTAIRDFGFASLPLSLDDFTTPIEWFNWATNPIA